MISGKQIHFNIDFEKTTPLYCEFLRGDSIEFHFDFNDTYNATKMRVLCYTKHGQYAFGDEFTNLNVATFYTNRTAGYSGLATITVQLLDDNENLINSANIACKIIESNTQTPFIVSPDFAEKSKVEIAQLVSEGKSQIVEATSKAKEKIDNWSDQTSRFAKNESDISNLQLFKANSGALHFDGGHLSCSSLANKQIPKENTIAFRWKIDKQTFDSLDNNFRIIGRQLLHYTLFKSGDNVQLTVMYDDNTQQHITIPSSNVTNGEWHSIVITSTSSAFNFYVDNVLLKSANKNKSNDFIIPSSSFIVSSSSATKSIGSIADVCYFNFDMSLADAPYTIADYQQGKPIPPKAFYGQDSFVGGIEQSYSWLRSGLTMTSNITFDENGTNFIFDNTNGTSADYQIVAFDVNIPKGAYLTAEGDWSNIYSVTAFNNSTSIGQIIATGNKITPLTLSADCTSLRIRPLSTGAGSTRTITLPPSCKIKVNGAILALEDYTITNGNSKFVFDYSGNNNDATITGDVKGDNDARIQKLVDFIKS